MRIMTFQIILKYVAQLTGKLFGDFVIEYTRVIQLFKSLRAYLESPETSRAIFSSTITHTVSYMQRPF